MVLAAGNMSENSAHSSTENMPEPNPPDLQEPLNVAPLSFLPPNIFDITLDSRYLGSSSNPFGQKIPTDAELLEEREGQIRMAKLVAESEMKRASKAKDREGVKGQWWPCDLNESDLKMLEDEGFVQKDSWRFTMGVSVPEPWENKRVFTSAWVERGLSRPRSDFFFEVLEKYGLQPHNSCLNAYTILSNFVTLCEGHLGLRPDFRLFKYFYQIKKETKDKVMLNYRSVTFVLRTRRVFPPMSSHESVRY